MKHAIVARIRPPAVACGYLILATVVHLVAPQVRLVTGLYRLAALVPVALGAGLMLWAVRCFERVGTTHDTKGEPRALVDDGPLAFSRNPMYLGMTILLAGVAGLVGTLPFFSAAVAFWVTIRLVFVPYEEGQLEAALGDPYREYKERVRRWL